jgi:LemA protein
MGPELIIPILFVLIILSAWSIGTYNKFVKYKNNIEESWSGIDVALKRRANLIPSLVKVIEGYGQHESSIFNDTRIEKTVKSNADRVVEESEISKSLGGLLALAEAYPDLKASDNFLSLQQSLDEIESEIVMARKRFNRNVGKLNTLVESFPATIIARKFGFTKQNYLDLELTTQRTMPDLAIKQHNDKKSE